MDKMLINISKENKSGSILKMSKEQQLSDNFEISYEDLKDKAILATILSHRYSLAVIKLESGTGISFLGKALLGIADNIKVLAGDTVDETVYDILSDLFPDEAGIIRKSKITGKNVFSELGI